MKIYHFSANNNKGGAARAASRIHHALLKLGLNSTMFVDELDISSERVYGPNRILDIFLSKARTKAANILLKSLNTKNSGQHSLSVFPSRWLKFINESDVDIVHLHWINREMLSISDIGKIKKPIVWTLHDMWSFSGAEHLCDDNRWKDGYFKNNRPLCEKGLDLNRWVFERKLKHWKEHINIVTPSTWLSECARSSYLMNSWPVSTIPNCLDDELWKPTDKQFARNLFGFPKDKKLILFGSYGSNATLNKGFDLLLKSLQALNNPEDNYELVVFGDSSQEQFSKLKIPIHFIGHIRNDERLVSLYNAADLMVIPSRQEAFGQVASEAQACGTPVVAFSTSGLKDIVEHGQTGYLAKPFDIHDFAAGIEWVGTTKDADYLSKKAKDRAHAMFSYRHVAIQYRSLYKKILNEIVED